MSKIQDKPLDWTQLKMPRFDKPVEAQYTGKGWRQVDAEGAQQKLRQTQAELAARQAEIVAGYVDE